jgi:Fur family ferric uptake transcriptional regulator
MADKSLKDAKLKNTPVRRGIIEILSSSNSPLSPSEVLSELKNKKIRADLSTVYRTLNCLTDNEITTRISIQGESSSLYEYNCGEHRHYLVCVKCKKIIPLEGCPLSGYEKTLESKTEYIIFSHKLSVYGICPDCQK